MIEEAIAKLTAAVEANTAAITAMIAASGNTPVAPVEVTKTKTKKAETKAEAKVEPEVTKEAEPEVIKEAEPEATYTLLEAINASKEFLAADREANKPKLASLRAEFGVETVKDLPENKIAAYMAKLATL